MAITDNSQNKPTNNFLEKIIGFEWKEVLGSDEVLKKEFGVGEKYLSVGFRLSIFLGILLLLIVVGIFFILWSIFYWKFYLRKSIRYAFTNKRVLVRKGLLNTRLISIGYEKITDIQVRENVIEKWLYQTGMIIINTAGTSYDEVVLDKVEEPYKVKQQLEELRAG